jgi:plastocyanin
MKKIVGIFICIFMTMSTISITAERSDMNTIPQPTTNAATITIYHQAFHPDLLIIEPNVTVTWTNIEPLPHSVVSDDDYFRSQVLGEDESYNYTFVKEGAYPYHDGLHNATKGLVYVHKGGNQPPFKPVIQGEANGSIKTTYNYSATSFDPEGTKISFYFDWGDNTNSGWSEWVNSTITMSHSWNRRGKFTVKVQAKDFYANATSAWAEFPVKMPVFIDIPFYHFIEKLFERFPNIFPILRHMMGY